MKSTLFILLGFFLLSESNNFVKSLFNPKNSAAECILCDGTPCKCEQLALKEADGKISLKKLIHMYLKKTNSRCSNSEACMKCRFCQQECPKNSIVVQVLQDILNRTNFEKKEEDSIRELIVKLLDPLDCKRKPCQIHCDPQVQRVLKTILKKGVKCNCNDCPSNCYMNPKLCKSKLYRYCFKASKDASTEENANKYWWKSEKQSDSHSDDKKIQKAPSRNSEALNKYDDVKKPCRCEFEYCERCNFCQRPERFICPRYITDECPTGENSNQFPICADCSSCRISPRNSKNYVSLFCKECRAMAWPFVQFTRNGYPQRQSLERQNGLLVRTRFLQINDFRTEKRISEKTVFNPFHPKCNIPRKRKGVIKLHKRS